MVPRLDTVVPCWICAPGEVPNCPYGLSGLVVWTMILQYVDPGNRIYLSKFLVSSRKQELFTVWVVDQFTLGHGLQGLSIIPSTWTALAETHLHSSQHHSGLDRASHTPLATSESETEAESKLEIKSDACFFCPLKVWMKSGAVHSSDVQQSFTGNSYSPVSMLSHQSPVLTFVPLPSAIIERHDVYF